MPARFVEFHEALEVCVGGEPSIGAMGEGRENFARAWLFFVRICGAADEDPAAAGCVTGASGMERTSDGEREQVGMAGRVQRVVRRADERLEPEGVLGRASLEKRDADFVWTGVETQALVEARFDGVRGGGDVFEIGFEVGIPTELR